jgi:DNA-binding transcriptional MocR family regulator
MTDWQPDLTAQTGPKYRVIAAALANDIASGVLPPDTRLPTHRDLAWKLGVTVGTVSRAYALAQSRGLIAGEVGRGTRVLPANSRQEPSAVAEEWRDSPVPTLFPLSERKAIEMSRNYPVDTQTDSVMAAALRRLADPEILGRLGRYQPPSGTVMQRQAGAAWLGYSGLAAEPESLVVTNGCQHALWVAFAALTGPGDIVATEDLTWPGARNLATTMGLQVHPVAMDEDGMRPDALDEACRTARPRLVYTIPTQQNPTATVMSEARRRDIVDVAKRHSIIIVEDGVFEFLPPDAPPPIAALAPDITVHATSLSKAVSPALRAGVLAAPKAMIPRFASVIQATTIMPPTFGAQLSADLILSGAAMEAAGRQRSIAAERLRMAERILGSHVSPGHSSASQLWLPLPEHWDSRSFASEALSEGVAVTPGDAFCADREAADPRAVRICLCAEAGNNRIEEGLGVVVGLLASHPASSAPIV